MSHDTSEARIEHLEQEVEQLHQALGIARSEREAEHSARRQLAEELEALKVGGERKLRTMLAQQIVLGTMKDVIRRSLKTGNIAPLAKAVELVPAHGLKAWSQICEALEHAKETLNKIEFEWAAFAQALQGLAEISPEELAAKIEALGKALTEAIAEARSKWPELAV